MIESSRRAKSPQVGRLPGAPAFPLPYLRALCMLAAMSVALCVSPCGAADDGPGPLSPILSGCEPDYPPFCIVTDDGEADGFSVELLRAALKAMGRDVTFKTALWTEIKDDLAEGRIQALPLVGRTPEREDAYDFTFPYLTLRGAIVVRDDTEGIASLDDLRGKRVAVMKGDNAEEFMRRVNVGAILVTTATFEDALNGLSEGGCDAVLMQRLLALRLMQQASIANLRFAGGPLEKFSQSFCFAVKEGDTETLSLLNEGLALVMADGTFRTLRTKWFADIEPPARSRFVLGSDVNYPPYEYVDENGEPTGFNVALTRAVADLLGLDVAIMAKPWAEVRQALDMGEIDAIQGMFYSLQRDRKYEFSQPHGMVHHGIVVRKDMPNPPQTMADLAGMRIAVMKDDMTYEFAVQYGYADQLTLVSDQEEALRQLALGQHDCVLAARVPTSYFIDKHNWDNLVIVGEPLLSAEYCYCFLDENRALAAHFTEALVELRQNGTYQRLRREWLGVYEHTPLETNEIMRYVGWAVSPVLLLFLIALAWVLTLRRQVAHRTQELRESEARFARAMDSANEGVWDWYPQTGEAYLSPRWKSMLGYTDDDDVGDYGEWATFIHPDDFEAVQRHTEDYVNGKIDKFEIEFRMRHRDGRWIDVLSRGGVAERAADGTILKLTGTQVDISQQKQLEEQLREAVTELERSNRELEEFAYVASHDLRSPLTALDSLTDWLAEDLGDDLSPQSGEHMRLMKMRVSRMQRLLDDLLEYSRAGRVESSVEPVDVGQMVRQTAEMMTGDTLVEVETTDLPVFDTAATPLRQVFANLISNAVKHHDRDECALTVTAKDIGALLEFRVIDDGPGIPPEHHEKVFGMFQALRPRDEREASGMGLALVRKLIERYGGTVRIESPGQRGTAVVFTWPKQVAKEPRRESSQ